MLLRINFWRRFRRAADGTTAVEFALIAPPFFLILFAILETASVFFASTTLENAVLEASRQIRTGQAQTYELTEDQFRDEICERIDMFMSCEDNLIIVVESFSSFNNLEFPDAFDNDGNMIISNSFDMGGAGEIMLVRVYYQWDVMTPVIGPVMANANNGDTRLIVATGVFRNEPFGSLLGDF